MRGSQKGGCLVDAPPQAHIGFMTNHHDLLPRELREYASELPIKVCSACMFEKWIVSRNSDAVKDFFEEVVREYLEDERMPKLKRRAVQEKVERDIERRAVEQAKETNLGEKYEMEKRMVAVYEAPMFYDENAIDLEIKVRSRPETFQEWLERTGRQRA